MSGSGNSSNMTTSMDDMTTGTAMDDMTTGTTVDGMTTGNPAADIELYNISKNIHCNTYTLPPIVTPLVCIVHILHNKLPYCDTSGKYYMYTIATQRTTL